MRNRRKRNQLACRTYWGTHGCDKRRDHPGPEHECSCGYKIGFGASEAGVTLFGEDADRSGV